MPLIACDTCGSMTPATHVGRCNLCWEVEFRLGKYVSRIGGFAKVLAALAASVVRDGDAESRLEHVETCARVARDAVGRDRDAIRRRIAPAAWEGDAKVDALVARVGSVLPISGGDGGRNVSTDRVGWVYEVDGDSYTVSGAKWGPLATAACGETNGLHHRTLDLSLARTIFRRADGGVPPDPVGTLESAGVEAAWVQAAYFLMGGMEYRDDERRLPEEGR